MSSSDSNFKILALPGIRLLIISSAIIFTFYGFLVGYNYVADTKSQKIIEKSVETEKLIGEVLNYGEVLTMSARMYVSTSNDFWEKRYIAHTDKQEQAVKKLLDFASKEEQARFNAKTSETAQKLLELEAEAFKLVGNGSPTAADSLLATSEYERGKNSYQAAIKDVSSIIREGFKKEQKSLTFNKLFFNAFGALLFIIAIFLAISAIRKSALYMKGIFEEKNKSIEKSEKELRALAEQQLVINEQLFLAQKQVQEQNEKLRKAEEEARLALERQEHANQKLLLAQRELQKTLVEQNRANQKLVDIQKALEQKNSEMERSEKEMRALAEAQLETNEKLLLAQRQEEKIKQDLAITLQNQEVLNKILQKSLLTNPENLQEFLEFTVDTLGEVRFLELLPGIGIFTKKEENVYELKAQRNISPKIQELCHNIKTGQCLCGLAIKTKETQYAHCVDERHTTRFEGIKEHGHYNVPILNQGEALGALVVYLPHGHQKKQSEVHFLEAVTNIIASTLTNVANQKQLQETLSMQEIMNASLNLAQQELAKRTAEIEASERDMRALAEAQLEVNEKLLISQREVEKAKKELEEALERISRSEQEAKILAKEFQELFDNSRDGLLLLDDKGFFKANSAAVQVYGCDSIDDLIGRSPVEYSPILQEDGQTSQEAALKHIQKALQEGSDLFEWIHTKKDGSIFPAEVLLSSVSFEGKKVLLATVRDISKRKQAEEELKKAFEKARRAEEDMRALAEAQLEVNEKLMLAEKQLKQTLELEQKQREELDRLVAQLKETQGQLVHNEKMASLGQLTAGIAHEINNPINFVYNGIDTLKISLDDLMEIVNKYNELDNANGNKDAVIEEAKKLKQELDFEELTQDIEHLVSDIKKGAVRTMEIVKGLRVFSRLDEEERKLASIKDCLEATLILLNNKMKGRIELKKYYDETMPDIMCYPGQLNQVFMNIINNAIQAIPEDRKDGVISIYTETQEENVIIRIRDNGTGMSEQVKRRIFEPFFTTKAVGVGTGLGLSITFGIIEKHNGQIFVNSEEGKGTEFVIQLPKQG
ncbi:MAG: hypothetical protein OHK0045_05790 [Raineya sp.]